MSSPRPPRRRRANSAFLARPVLEALEGRVLFAALTIAQENGLAGNPRAQWDIIGFGDPNLQGYATDMSVNVGQTIKFKIDDKTLAPYHIDIYRLGYYQNLGARFIANIPDPST